LSKKKKVKLATRQANPVATRTSISILGQARTSTRVERPRQTQGHTNKAPVGHTCTPKSRRRPVPDEDKPPPLLSGSRQSAQCRHTAVATCHVCASSGSMRPCSSSSSVRVVVDWYPGGDRDGARPWHRRPPRGVDPSLGRQACSWIPRLHGHPSLPHGTRVRPRVRVLSAGAGACIPSAAAARLS
jgi:hypothetical protein